MDEIEFFNCYIIYRPGKDQLAADALSRKPNTNKDVDPPETQNSLFQVNQEPQDNSFSTLLRYQRQLRSGFDPKLIGSGNFQLLNQKLYKKPDEYNGTQPLAVPTSEREAESIVKNLHEDLGHRNEKDLLMAIKERY